MRARTPGEREDRTLEILQDFARRGRWARQLAVQKTRELLSGWTSSPALEGEAHDE